MKESIDYSVDNLKSNKKYYDIYDESRSYLKLRHGDTITQEYFTTFKTDILENIVPEISNMLPWMDVEVKINTQEKLAVSFIGDETGPKFKMFETEGYIERVSIIGRILNGYLSIRLGVRIAYGNTYVNTDEFWTYFSTTPVKRDDKFHNAFVYSLYDDWICKLIIELIDLIGFPDVNITEDFFKPMRESIDYSVNGLKDNALSYTHKYDFTKLPIVKLVDYNYYESAVEDIDTNLVEEILDLFPYLDLYRDREDFVATWHFEMPHSEIDKHTFAWTGHAYNPEEVPDWFMKKDRYKKQVAYISDIDITLAWRGIRDKRAIELKQKLTIFNKTGGFKAGYIELTFNSGKYLNDIKSRCLVMGKGLFRSLEDRSIAQKISDFIKILDFGEDFNMMKPETYLPLDESVDYSVSKLNKVTDENQYTEPYSLFKLKKNTKFSVEGNYYDYFYDDLKENILPDILDIFPEFYIADKRHNSDAYTYFLKPEEPVVMPFIKETEKERNLIIDVIEVNVVPQFDSDRKNYGIDFWITIMTNMYNLTFFIMLSSDDLDKKTTIRLDSIKSFKGIFVNYDDAKRFSELIALFSPMAANKYTPEYFLCKKVDESIDYSVSNIPRKVSEYNSPYDFLNVRGSKVSENYYKGFVADIQDNIIPDIINIFPQYMYGKDKTFIRNNYAYWYLCSTHIEEIPIKLYDSYSETKISDISLEAKYFPERESFNFIVSLRTTADKSAINIYFDSSERSKGEPDIDLEINIQSNSVANPALCESFAEFLRLFKLDVPATFFLKE